LRRRGKRLTLSIQDDGTGFSPRLRHPETHGLIGMRERAKLLGGRLQVSSGPGKGTRVVARVPLDLYPLRVPGGPHREHQ
jgi:signal transduction histidine kinase